LLVHLESERSAFALDEPRVPSSVARGPIRAFGGGA
jgi:hypothetical protein